MSIRRRLLLGLLVALALLALAAGSFLYFYMKALLTGHFDATLVAEAHAFCSLIKKQPTGELEFESALESMPEFAAGGTSHFFQISDDRGRVISRSPATLDHDLAPGAVVGRAPRFWDTPLANGRPGRAVALRYLPTIDDDSPEPAELAQQAAKPRSAWVDVIVAQDRSELDRTMRILLSALLLTMTVMGVGIVAIAAVTVGSSLRPLRRLADEAARIDASSLSHRFSLAGLPSELLPICTRLNDLLGRLEDAFARERRFTADVAHELRTPIAELRSLADVALKWQDDPASSATFFKDVQEIARQMETLVTSMLALARGQSGSICASRERVAVGDLVEEAWRPYQQRASERRLSASFEVPGALVLQSDRFLLRSILDNLLSNAVEYTPCGGSLACKAAANGAWVSLSVSNDHDTLNEEDLPHLFEAFWRKDPSRTDAAHSGVGLTVVATYVALLGGKVAARLEKPRSVSITLDLPWQPR